MMFGWGLILVVVVLAVWAMSQGRGPWGGPGGDSGREEDRAESILREQYARGDIDEETYRRRLNELRRE